MSHLQVFCSGTVIVRDGRCNLVVLHPCLQMIGIPQQDHIGRLDEAC